MYTWCSLFGQVDSLPTPEPEAIPETEMRQFSVSFAPEPDAAVLLISHDQDGKASISINGEEVEFIVRDGTGRIDVEADEAGRLFMLRSQSDHSLVHVAKLSRGGYRYRHIPLWLSVLPPLIAIALALIFKEVVVSLFTGVWVGAFIAGGLRFESFFYIIQSFFKAVSEYVIGALNDSGHLAVIVFSLLIGGMVAIISKNGGMAGVVLKMSRYARSARSSQFVTWVLGVAIFFDDYANTLIVGNTMRTVTDRFRVSREKLAYIVDSTAAPIAAIAFITTWIGAELGYIDSGLSILQDFPFEMTPYAVFLGSLRYAFYPVLTLAFILMLVYTGRDFGPMLAAEQRARATGHVSSAATPEADEPNMEELGPVSGAPLRWYNAVVPVLVVILVTIYGLLETGIQATYAELLSEGVAVASSGWSDVITALPALLNVESAGFFRVLGKIIGNADSYQALLWSSLSGVTIAILLTVSQRIIKLFDTMHYLTMGFKTMMPALIILTLAWSLATATEQLHTADYLTSLLLGSIHPQWMPAIVFVLAAVIAFSTGSSWSTMAILYPIAIPTTWVMCSSSGLDPNFSLEILLNVIATVISASVVGDHCSPISDTTILSSLASDCNHIDHVRTQMPYALTVASVSLGSSIVATYLGGGWGISVLCVIISLLLLYVIIRRKGTLTTDYAG